MDDKGESEDQPNTDVLLEVVGYEEEGSGTRHFRKRMFFPFRPVEGEDMYFEGNAKMNATVVLVNWHICGNKACLQVRLEMSVGLSNDDVVYLKDCGWIAFPVPSDKDAEWA